MKSTAAPVLVVAFAILLALWFGMKADPDMGITAGLYAVALAGVGMLSTLGRDPGDRCLRPGSRQRGRHCRDESSAVGGASPHGCPRQPGQHHGGDGQGFAIGSAVLTALALVGAYMSAAGMTSLDVLRPTVLPGLLIGANAAFPLYGAHH